MGIQVECPHGHIFKVKDKYAGKRGLCPHCKGQVVVLVPDALHSPGMENAYRRAVNEEQRHAAAHATATGSDSSVLDDMPREQDADTSGSLLGSSVIKHSIRCEFCHESVPMWFAKCPSCGHFIEHR